MRASRPQTTLARPCTVSGRGYWTGQLNTLTFLPAPADTGIRFIRSDLPGKPRASAVSANVAGRPMRTLLQNGSAVFEMVEHVMSALYGLQIDNIEVHCTASEMPGLDGSSHAYALALTNAGIAITEKQRSRFAIKQTLQVGDEEAFVRIDPPIDDEADALELVYELDYGSSGPIQPSVFAWTLNPSTYLDDIAAARTFIRWSDAQILRQKGLAAHVTERDLLVFDDVGPVDNQLRFKDECCRHKLLDLLGDLAMTGCDLVGRIVARRSGHELNAEMTAAIVNLMHLESECERSSAA